jgi:CheY-like chemotaxis protein
VRIDVADPGSERLAIVAALVGAGFEVEATELGDVIETRADLLVLAADAPDALTMLRRLRDDGRRPDVPVVLLGTPEGAAPISEGPGFGAELVLARPVDEERLVAGVRRLLREHLPDRSIVERLVPEHTLELRERETQDDEERDDPSGVSAIRSMDDGGERPERKSAPAPRPSSAPQPTGVSQIERRSEVPLSVVTTGTGSSQVSGSTADFAQAPISDSLRTVLTAADRRVFPGLAAIDVSIPAGEASARELVPDEIFDDASPESEGEDDGLFVIAPLASVLGASGSSAPPRIKRPSSEPPPERDKKTSPGTPLSLGGGFKLPSVLPPRPDAGGPAISDDDALGPLDPSGARRLPITPGAMMRALAAIVLGRSSTRVIVTSPSLDAELGFSRGELSKIDGPVARFALARLNRSATDEASARARIAMLRERGEVSVPGEALLLARGERDVLARVLMLAEGEAVFHAARDEDLPARLGPTGRVLGQIAAETRAHASVDHLLSKLGAHGRLEPTRALGGAAAALGLNADVTRFFEQAEEGPTRLDLARAAHVAPELPAVTALLVAAGALAIAPGRAESAAIDGRAAEQIVREHASRADDADYFSLLGVTESASEAEIGQAHDGRRALLAALPLDEIGLGALVPLRTVAIAALDEAFEVLGNPALRAAYARALAGTSPARPGAPSPGAV